VSYSYSISVISGSFFALFADTSSSFSSSLVIISGWVSLSAASAFCSLLCVLKMTPLSDWNGYYLTSSHPTTSLHFLLGTYPNNETFNPYFYIVISARFEGKTVHVELYFCLFRTSFRVGWIRTSCTAIPRSWSPTLGMCTPHAASQPAQRNRNSCHKTFLSYDVIQCVKKRALTRFRCLGITKIYRLPVIMNFP